jgi:hypothetical protein
MEAQACLSYGMTRNHWAVPFAAGRPRPYRSWSASPAAGGTAVFQCDATLTNVAGELYGPSVAALSRAGVSGFDGSTSHV